FQACGLNAPPNGTHTVYDDAGRVLRSERVSGLRINVQPAGTDVWQATLTSVGAVYATTQTAYDEFGRVRQTRDAANQPTDYSYNKRGQTTQVRNALGYLTDTEYDDAGRAVFVTDPHASGTGPFPGTRTAYDDAGRPIQVTFADGTYTRTGYDDLGRRQWQEDELRQRTDFAYDPYGRLTAVVQPAVADPEQGGARVRPRTEYTYDV